MSEESFQKEVIETVSDPSLHDRVEPRGEYTGPPMFYRCACTECGKYALTVNAGVSRQTALVGITSSGEIGCSTTELDTDYQLGIFCRACRHELCGDSFPNDICQDEFLSEWAEKNGEARSTLAFDCPECGSRELPRVQVGIECSTAVVAVCEVDARGNVPLIAVSHLRETGGRGSYRYRCSQGHELAKDDGTPVETAEELIEWLKARCARGNG